MKSSFDTLASTYDKELKDSLGKFGGKDIEKFAEYKIKILQQKVFKIRTPDNILEFGCGTGRNHFFMVKYFPESEIYGCDISEKSIKKAKSENPTIQYDRIVSPDELVQAYKIPFDCIFISNVFHHIPLEEHQKWLTALHKILSDDGFIIIFEHNPFNPLTRHVFNNSIIDKGATMLKPSYCLNLLRNTKFSQVSMKYTLFFPWRNIFLETIERMLYFLPLGAQYYMCGKK